MRYHILFRYQASCKDAKRLAEEVARSVSRESTLFEGSVSEGTLLIIDRSEDPVTPLLNQWTYEAMVLDLPLFKSFFITSRSVDAEASNIYSVFFYQLSGNIFRFTS